MSQVYKLNEECKILIDTLVGQTDEIRIQEIVKQGTVWARNYAVHQQQK